MEITKPLFYFVLTKYDMTISNSYILEHREEMVGLRIRCVHMYDPSPVEPNSLGTITYIDDMGTIHVKWDSGRTLGIVPEEDNFEIINP